MILWNVDTQRDFMLPGGKLYIPGADAIIPNLKRLGEFAVEKNYSVVTTADWHDENTKEISSNPDFKKTFPPHCIAGTEGAKIIDELKCVVDYKYGLILLKDEFDVFGKRGNRFATALAYDFDNPDVPIVVFGVASDVCVDYAIRGLADFAMSDIWVVTDAIKGLPACDHVTICKRWAENYKVKLVTTAEVCHGK